MTSRLGPQARRVYDELLRRILGGELQPGDRLPSQPDLARECNVALMTARLALAQLELEGLVSSKQGRGTFVAHFPAAAGVDGEGSWSYGERFRAIFQRAAIGINLSDDQGYLVEVNPTFARMLGYREEELKGVHFSDITDPRDRDLDRHLFHELLAGERDSYQIEKRYIRKDGEPKWVRLSVSAIMDVVGKSGYSIGMAQDINMRRQAEDALRESEERFRATFDQAAVGIAHSTLDGRWLLINQRLLDFYGYTRQELERLRFHDVTHPEDLEADLGQLERLRAGEISAYSLEKRYVRKDGSIVHGNITVSLVRDSEGEPKYTIAVIEDISARKRVEAALKHQALHDPLTDLPNRTLLQDRLDQAIAAARREGSEVALLLMDLDRFKEINDTFGHHHGDILLQQVAQRLKGTLRESDTVARLGGDEFAVVLPESGEGAAVQTAEKLVRHLSEPFTLEEQRFDVGASLGIAIYPQHGEDASNLIRRADIAMYVAKRLDSRHAVYRPEQDENSPTRLQLMPELRGAISQNELMLHYQPKVDLHTGTIDGVEALLRWVHPQRGFVPPGQFIPLAEHSGLIKQLTLWVLQEALHQCWRWLEAGIDLRVAVNLSPQNLRDPQLVDTVERLLRQHEVPAANLQLELTESLVMADALHSMHVLGRLHEMGVAISIDDFGTGYSSLGYLKRLPVDAVKIDRSFISDMILNEDDRFIVNAIVELGHNLGLRVVAEGIENLQTLDALTAMGCDEGQGFYLGRPAPAEDVIAALLPNRQSA